MEITPATAEQT